MYVKEDVLPPAAILAELRSLGTDIVTLQADDKRCVSPALARADPPPPALFYSHTPTHTPTPHPPLHPPNAHADSVSA